MITIIPEQQQLIKDELSKLLETSKLAINRLGPGIINIVINLD